MSDIKYKLNKYQKESILLLQIGTFLEYFDLMLYVHMAVVLNELFFPKTDPKMAAILAAFAFCSTYVLRPFGALIFGYIGDNYGRKPTVIITTSLMALSCLTMATLPTYADIGITAAVIVSLLRIIQGMSSMGEVMGARIYITEITKPPVQYSAVCYVSISVALGSISALGVATLATRVGFNWRIAFIFGMVIALVGIVARTRLRETPDFADAKRKMQNTLNLATEGGLDKPAALLLKTNYAWDEKVNKKSFFHFFSVFCGWPLSFYLAYIYFIPTLKDSCGYTSADIILHNFYLSLFQLFTNIVILFLTKRIYPLYISKFIGFFFLFSLFIMPFVMNGSPNNYTIFLIQILFVSGLRETPSDPILIKHFPVFKRFTAATFGYALSRAVMYIFISFGLVYLTNWFGYYGVWILAFPITFFWLKAVFYYSSLEKAVGHYPKKGEWQVEG
ncbi:MAG: MFS transporter [Rickettsiaceae bacterium]|nr:MFS transporter [Rickettsiaceae bacterium]